MDERQKILRQLIDLVMEAHKIEDEMLEIPKEAAREANLDVDMLFSTEVIPKFMEKYDQLKAVEAKRDEVHERWLNSLR